MVDILNFCMYVVFFNDIMVEGVLGFLGQRHDISSFYWSKIFLHSGMKYRICTTLYLLQHLDASSLFVQLLLLVFHLGLQVAKLLLNLGQRGLILRLLGGQILQLGLQLLHLHVRGAQFSVLVLQAEETQ